MGHFAWAFDYEMPTQSTSLAQAKGDLGPLVTYIDSVNDQRIL